MGIRSNTRLRRLDLFLVAVLSFVPTAQASDFFKTMPEWSFRNGCASLFRGFDTAKNIPPAIGIPNAELLGLSRFASTQEYYVVILKPTLGSLRFHGEPGAIAKPMKVLLRKTTASEGTYYPFPFKSARVGRMEGSVVRPSVESFPVGEELQNAEKIWEKNWPLFHEHGFTIDANGVVRNPDGHFYFSDYDLLIVMDKNGNRISFGSDGDHVPKVKGLLQPLNEAVGPELFRHDGYFEKEYFDKMVSTSQATIILGPNGDAWSRPANDVPKLIEHLRKNAP